MSDINGGAGYPNANGSPIGPGTSVAGPLIAGNVLHSDGTGNLAALGGSAGTANAGYAHMTQSEVITQAASAGQAAGVYKTGIVIPAQSQITAIKAMVTTALTGSASTFGIGDTVSATAFTLADAVVTSGALGQVSVTPGTGATQIANWDNVGNTDVQIVVKSTNTGNGVMTLTVQYVQGINLAS
jgi:hypothetical protein